ncbi:MAG TPA: hypothetical protein VIY73_27515, partial [Polyangiaceae bacterium]
DREAAVLETREQADRERQEALSSQAAQLKQEHEGKMAALREAKETGDAAHEAAAADLQKRLADTTADLGKKLADTTSARDDLEKKHAAASDKVVALEAELASVRHELGESRQKLAGESSRADKAHAKWDADRQSLERAKDALAVALAQIEEAEGRPLS